MKRGSEIEFNISISSGENYFKNTKSLYKQKIFFNTKQNEKIIFEGDRFHF